jgi:hypothetical protein
MRGNAPTFHCDDNCCSDFSLCGTKLFNSPGRKARDRTEKMAHFTIRSLACYVGCQALRLLFSVFPAIFLQSLNRFFRHIKADCAVGPLAGPDDCRWVAAFISMGKRSGHSLSPSGQGGYSSRQGPHRQSSGPANGPSRSRWTALLIFDHRCPVCRRCRFLRCAACYPYMTS